MLSHQKNTSHSGFTSFHTWAIIQRPLRSYANERSGKTAVLAFQSIVLAAAQDEDHTRHSCGENPTEHGSTLTKLIAAIGPSRLCGSHGSEEDPRVLERGKASSLENSEACFLTCQFQFLREAFWLGFVFLPPDLLTGQTALKLAFSEQGRNGSVYRFQPQLILQP